MQIFNIDPHCIKITIEKSDYNLDEYYDNLLYLEKKKILTFGDTNFRILETFFKNNNYVPVPLDLCFDDDKSIGLEMPNTWYLNKGKHALSIAMYYNYLNFHGIVENKNLETFNASIVRDYGRLAALEIYLEDELIPFLNKNNIHYFGTPRTLTECVRYLEGWSIEKYPRLKGYAMYSKFIELWSRINYPHFNFEEWYLGKEKSKRINKNGNTNVRKAVRYFWENYLAKRVTRIAEEDVEIDILDGVKFFDVRQPKFIIFSEDLFSDENSEEEIFKNLTKRITKNKIFFSKKKNDFPEKNMEIAKLLFPESIIVLVQRPSSDERNFSLMTPIKQSINENIVITTKIVKALIEGKVLHSK